MIHPKKADLRDINLGYLHSLPTLGTSPLKGRHRHVYCVAILGIVSGPAPTLVSQKCMNISGE
jgi:hypothetical protein